MRRIRTSTTVVPPFDPTRAPRWTTSAPLRRRKTPAACRAVMLIRSPSRAMLKMFAAAWDPGAGSRGNLRFARARARRRRGSCTSTVRGRSSAQEDPLGELREVALARSLGAHRRWWRPGCHRPVAIARELGDDRCRSPPYFAGRSSTSCPRWKTGPRTSPLTPRTRGSASPSA